MDTKILIRFLVLYCYLVGQANLVSDSSPLEYLPFHYSQRVSIAFDFFSRIVLPNRPSIGELLARK